MKTAYGLPALCALCVMTATAQQGGEASGPLIGAGTAYVGSATEEDVLALRKARPFGGGIPRDATRRVYDLGEMSDFISFADRTVIVPKGAILHVPERLRDSVAGGRQGKLLGWKEFLSHHAALVSELEVTLEEASGASPISPERLESAARSGRMVVAVIRGNPTSVHRTNSGEATRQPAGNP